MEWDRRVRAALPAEAVWYARINNGSDRIMPSTNMGLYRREQLTRDLHAACRAAGIPYLSPHKLRHGFAVYGVKNAKDMRALKAVSQNLMHSSLTITDGIYGNLGRETVRDAITSLGRAEDVRPAGDDAVILALRRLLAGDVELRKLLLSGFNSDGPTA
jgi:site-specific recombinase XerD